MKNRNKNIIFIAIGVLVLFFIYVFSYERTIWNFGVSVDANLLSDFGSFISGILSVFVLYMLVQTYDESTKQSFDNTFFNLLGIHESMIQGLRSRESVVTKLNESSKSMFEANLCDTLDESLKGECNLYKNKVKEEPAHDFFEILYRILHIQHKYKTKGDFEGVEKYFKDYKWYVGHFFRSYISLVELIDNNRHLTEEKKAFYSDILKSISSSDETRLVFYYILGQNFTAKKEHKQAGYPENNKISTKKKWKLIAKMFYERGMFSEEEHALIWNKENEKSDWKKFIEIVSDSK